MTLTRSAGVTLLASLLLFGCQTKKKVDPATLVPPPVPATPEVRQRLQRLSPNALIGRVVAVLPDERLAAVADIPPKSARLGDLVAFWGGEEVFLTHGEILRASDGHLHIRYEAVQPGRRPPAVGDLVVYESPVAPPK